MEENNTTTDWQKLVEVQEDTITTLENQQCTPDTVINEMYSMLGYYKQRRNALEIQR